MSTQPAVRTSLRTRGARPAASGQGRKCPRTAPRTPRTTTHFRFEGPLIVASGCERWGHRNTALTVGTRVFWESRFCLSLRPLPPPASSQSVPGSSRKSAAISGEWRLRRERMRKDYKSRQASRVAAQYVLGDVVFQGRKPRHSAGGVLNFP